MLLLLSSSSQIRLVSHLFAVSCFLLPKATQAAVVNAASRHLSLAGAFTPDHCIRQDAIDGFTCPDECGPGLDMTIGCTEGIVLGVTVYTYLCSVEGCNNGPQNVDCTDDFLRNTVCHRECDDGSGRGTSFSFSVFGSGSPGNEDVSVVSVFPDDVGTALSLSVYEKPNDDDYESYCEITGANSCTLCSKNNDTGRFTRGWDIRNVRGGSCVLNRCDADCIAGDAPTAPKPKNGVGFLCVTSNGQVRCEDTYFLRFSDGETSAGLSFACPVAATKMAECSCEVTSEDRVVCNSCSFGQDGYMAFDCCNLGLEMDRVGFTADGAQIDLEDCKAAVESPPTNGGGSSALSNKSRTRWLAILVASTVAVLNVKAV